MTTEDLYVHALSSSSLRIIHHRMTDIDVVIAAGVVGSGLATMLYRLHAEFDASRGELQRQIKHRDASGRVRTHGLRGYTTTRSALFNFMVMSCKRLGFEPSKLDIQQATDRVLDLILSPTCERCSGVRFKVLTGTGRLSAHACDPPKNGGCGGTGLRTLRVPRGTKREEVVLMKTALADIERKMDHVNQRISAYLKGRQR